MYDSFFEIFNSVFHSRLGTIWLAGAYNLTVQILQIEKKVATMVGHSFKNTSSMLNYIKTFNDSINVIFIFEQHTI